MLIGEGSTWLFIGDSITDAGRARPVGERDGLGNGYVKMIDAVLQTWHPERRVRVLNTGIGGNQARHLEERWQADVLDLRPQWLSIMIGINDVWRRFDCPLKPAEHVSVEDYEATLGRLIARSLPVLRGLVLATPYMIEANREDPMRSLMDEFSAVVRRLAAKHGALLVDTQAAFDRALHHAHPMAIAWDRIHPGHHGHMVIARAFLEAVGAL